MILSRLGPLSRLTASVARNLMQESNSVNFKQAVRTEKTYAQYRNPTPPDEYVDKMRKHYMLFSISLWWYLIWRFASEYHIIFGPFMPNPSKWTDEELGIPPLEAEDP